MSSAKDQSLCELDARRTQAVLNTFNTLTVEIQRGRINQGVLLVAIEKQAMWQGRASSFSEFLESEHTNTHNARRLMRVARKFFYELSLEDEDMDTLAIGSITTLEVAARVATKENYEIVLGIVATLSERDAILSLNELAEGGNGPVPANKDPLTRALGAYSRLPTELKAGFHQTLEQRRRHVSVRT